ncbi:hypothetical protein AVW11_28010 [Streptomyces amritsarensis]|uniref:Uncharacterized protein n=2 Tax=Streptomyces TaxID=1883 RepID=A0ABX3FZ96_9ACTN|nr:MULTISPECIES: hypothetical protein [Streptomyces]OLZ58539.1 hypothetical protein AVW11_28010 [Streptomyces amritsarensis]
MFRTTSRKQRFAMYAVSAAIVGGGVLVPTSAFAAPATAGTTSVAAPTSGHESKNDNKKEKWENKNKKHGKDKKHEKNKKNKKHQGKKNKVRDVENMPGCKFYQGKVYCEHKPDKPAPAPNPAPPAPPKPDTKPPAPNADPVVMDKENPDKVQTPAA